MQRRQKPLAWLWPLETAAASLFWKSRWEVRVTGYKEVRNTKYLPSEAPYIPEPPLHFVKSTGIYLHKSLTQHLNKQPVSNKTIKMLLDLADPPLITHQPTSLEIMTLRCFTKVRTGYQGLRS